ncbi:SNARE complex subunit [Aspergillus californicus]
MPNPSQLFLLADHIKLSLLERQRAISLDLEPNSQDGEISRSLDSFREGIEAVESQVTRLEESNDDAASDYKDQLFHLRTQYSDLSAQFHGPGAATGGISPDGSQSPQFNVQNSSPDLKQPVPQHPQSKSVRFMDDSAAAAAAEEDLNRRNLFQPYRDEPSPDGVDTSGMDNEQIYAHHEQTMRDQDDQLDRLGESIGRQHQLSIQIGDELDGHVALLDNMDGTTERHQNRLDNARRRIDKIRRKASDNLSMMTIIGLIILLVILIVLLK